MSNTLGRVLSNISAGKTPVDALLPVFLGQGFYLLSLLLPLGFFLGVMFAFGRLYKDHELVVLQACGFGYRQLYQSVLLVLFPVLLLTVWLSLWFGAQMQQRAVHIVDELESRHEFLRLKVGQFNQNKNSDQVFFMQSMSPDQLQIEDIIVSQTSETLSTLETARSGRQRLDEKTGDLFLEMGPGVRYTGKVGDADFRVVEFEKHGVLMKKKPGKISRLDSYQKHFDELLASNQLKDQVELWWRISRPLSLFMLALLAVPLSYISPRQGRYGKIGISLMVFIVYLNLMALNKSALEDGSLPLWVNFWGVHGLVAGLALLLLMRRNNLGWFRPAAGRA
jgi:lipopolysaccharide export system permease protein